MKYDLPDRIRKVKNIIFDMDGTLVNTALATVPACQEIALKYDLPVKSEAEIKQLIGCAGLEFYYRLYPGYDKDVLAKFAIDADIAENKHIQDAGTQILFPGVVTLLNLLKAYNYFISIASTGSNDHVEVSLKSAGIYNMFEKIKCNEPEKTKMVKLIKDTNPKGEWLIVGDKNSDYMAGKNNGIITVAARYGFGRDDEYNRFDFGIDSPQKLLELIGL